MIHEYGTDKKEIFVILLILLFHWIFFHFIHFHFFLWSKQVYIPSTSLSALLFSVYPIFIIINLIFSPLSNIILVFSFTSRKYLLIPLFHREMNPLFLLKSYLLFHLFLSSISLLVPSKLSLWDPLLFSQILFLLFKQYLQHFISIVLNLFAISILVWSILCYKIKIKKVCHKAYQGHRKRIGMLSSLYEWVIWNLVEMWSNR